jgi:hypothetical protein
MHDHSTSPRLLMLWFACIAIAFGFFVGGAFYHDIYFLGNTVLYTAPHWIGGLYWQHCY